MSGSRDYGTTLRASLALLTGGIGGRPDMLAKSRIATVAYAVSVCIYVPERLSVCCTAGASRRLCTCGRRITMRMYERFICCLEESIIRTDYRRAPFYRILHIRSACGNIGDGYSVSQRTTTGNKALIRIFRERYGNGSAIIGIIQTAAVFDIAYREGSGLDSKRKVELAVGTNGVFYNRTGT